MVANVRNFWIEADIDGRKTKLAGGPRCKDGGIELTIKQRVRGNIVTVARVEGYAVNDNLMLSILTLDNEDLLTTYYTGLVRIESKR